MQNTTESEMTVSAAITKYSIVASAKKHVGNCEISTVNFRLRDS
jgi:hypothetical protein